MGPRNHGSEGKARADARIQQALRDAGAEVFVHEFRHTPKGGAESVTFRNIIERIKPGERRRVVSETHYNTRSCWKSRPFGASSSRRSAWI